MFLLNRFTKGLRLVPRLIHFSLDRPASTTVHSRTTSVNWISSNVWGSYIYLDKSHYYQLIPDMRQLKVNSKNKKIIELGLHWLLLAFETIMYVLTLTYNTICMHTYIYFYFSNNSVYGKKKSDEHLAYQPRSSSLRGSLISMMILHDRRSVGLIFW